ncbi:MAG TPA: glycosyltransferase [Candidatus Woesebacteria bacterium]|nr:glycosyltransferase [Candidatus Woesebacteria bacterium]
MISTDRKIFEETSAVRARMAEYASLFEKLEIVVFAQKSEGFSIVQIAPNCRIYSTNSLTPLFYIWDALKQGRKILKGEIPAGWVITCQDPFETGLVGWWLTREFCIKLNLQVHTDVFNPFFITESIKNRIRAWLAKKLLPKADSIRVVSERIKKSITNLNLKTEPIVLPIFTSSRPNLLATKDDLHKKYPQFDFIILMASRLTQEKNFSLALRSLRQVTKKKPKLGLVIVGNGPERKKIEAEIMHLGLQNNVTLEKWNDNLSDYYQTADLFLLTSNYEGYGRTLIEAAEVGCPILTTDVGIVGEILNDDNSLICHVGDEDCLAKKIIWAAANQSELKKCAQELLSELPQKVIFNQGEYLKKYRDSMEDVE